MTTEVAELFDLIDSLQSIIKTQSKTIELLEERLQFGTLPSLPWFPGADFSGEPIDKVAMIRFAYTNRLDRAFREFLSMSNALQASDQIDASLLQRIDKVFCACIGLAAAECPRMHLLKEIEAAVDSPLDIEDYRIKEAIALSRLGQPTSPEQKKLIDDHPEYMRQSLGDELYNKMTMEMWSTFLRGLRSRADTYARVRYGFARLYPEHAERLTEKDVREAVRVWPARGARTHKRERPIKWEFLADLVARIGLGKLKPKTLEQEWIKWVKLRRELPGGST